MRMAISAKQQHQQQQRTLSVTLNVKVFNTFFFLSCCIEWVSAMLDHAIQIHICRLWLLFKQNSMNKTNKRIGIFEHRKIYAQHYKKCEIALTFPSTDLSTRCLCADVFIFFISCWNAMWKIEDDQFGAAAMCRREIKLDGTKCLWQKSDWRNLRQGEFVEMWNSVAISCLIIIVIGMHCTMHIARILNRTEVIRCDAE